MSLLRGMGVSEGFYTSTFIIVLSISPHRGFLSGMGDKQLLQFPCNTASLPIPSAGGAGYSFQATMVLNYSVQQAVVL